MQTIELKLWKFQSTPSPRRATHTACSCRQALLFQSTPSPRRATLVTKAVFRKVADFNPRPPRGGRQRFPLYCGHYIPFQSTPSPRRATLGRVSAGLPLYAISIHALPAEGDRIPGALLLTYTGYFNPRPPRGGRRERGLSCGPAGRISIHALPAEGDDFIPCCCNVRLYFNPRPPRGGRRNGGKI